MFLKNNQWIFFMHNQQSQHIDFNSDAMIGVYTIKRELPECYKLYLLGGGFVNEKTTLYSR